MNHTTASRGHVMKIRLKAVALAVAVGLMPAMAAGAPGARAGASRPAPRRAAPARIERDTRANVLSQARRVDINNINMFVTNYGTFANDIENQGNSGLFFPKGTIKTAVYQSGIWLVGKVGSQVRAAIAEYSQEYQPGTMNVLLGPGVFGPDDPKKADYQVYKVLRWTGNPADTDHVERPAAAVSADRTLDPIAHHSWSEYVKGAAPYGAPTRWYHLNSNAPNDSVLGPDVRGDQMLWSVYNDADPSAHNNGAGSTAPLGIEVQQSTFAFDRQGALGNTIFLEFKIINKGGSSIDSCYINLWADPDLGGAGDDLVGCDTTLSLGYIYNATNADQIYADRPPCVGYDFFQGPRVGSTTLGLTSFIFYINGTDPQNAVETYNYMKGFHPDGSPFLDPNGNPTKFYASGDPVAGTGYLDTNRPPLHGDLRPVHLGGRRYPNRGGSHRDRTGRRPALVDHRNEVLRYRRADGLRSQLPAATASAPAQGDVQHRPRDGESAVGFGLALQLHACSRMGVRGLQRVSGSVGLGALEASEDVRSGQWNQGCA